ncbi:heavy-metal-associated domain-containing protein [Noviherbaspirillum sp. UKPF54]|uniref:heavy-metal-associated domain-containing protein n=1 Tax=Noviherbaspirillum sp. UKPF54 TaxID=2601898 RepID=UPI0011B1645F|nr:heavy-metal-associated domain-containing protein [Noviherbaspirillum sp. UKPF54]QDZ27992.1 heavy-metal-associated domain-containing protein [Noviherbaspirillum sp. UKPF54]
MQTETLKLTGMSSDACGENVKRALESLDGVASASVSVSCNKVVVQFDEDRLAKQQLHAAIKQAGYGVVSVRAVDLSGNGGGSCCGGCGCG